MCVEFALTPDALPLEGATDGIVHWPVLGENIWRDKYFLEKLASSKPDSQVNPRRWIVTNSNMGFADPPLGVREPQKTPQTIEKRPQ